MNRKLLGGLWLAGALVVGVLLGGGTPVILQATPWAVETALASAIDIGPRLPPCPLDADDAALLDQLVERVRRPDDAFPLQVTLVRDDEENAFATLGARVFILSGLLREVESPEELAGVLAHEIEHVRRRHVLQGALIRLLTQAVLGDETALGVFMDLQFSQSQEAEADRGALERLRAGHIDPQGWIDFFERHDDRSALAFLSTHPSSGQRAALARTALQGHIAADDRPMMDAAEWERFKALCAE